MSLFFRRSEERAISYQDVFGSGGDVSIFADSANTALTLIPVYAATSLIADQLCAAPWAAYTTRDNAPLRLPTQPRLLTDPHPDGLDVYSWRHQMWASLLLWGNAYGWVVSTDSAGLPAQVVWLRPDQMMVDEKSGTPQYIFAGQPVDRQRLIHIPLYVLPGSVKGLSPIGLFRNQIETGLESQNVAKKFYRRGAVPSGVLKNTARVLTSEQTLTAKERFVASVSSSEPFVTGSDWDYKSLGLPQSDVNFLSGIKANATQIAAIYRVPPEEIGGETGGGSLTYKNLEQDMIRFNTRTLRPLASRIEAVFNRILQGTPRGATWYVKHNLDAGARADLKTRYESHEIGIRAKFLTQDEVRALEERPPLTPEQRDEMKSTALPAPVTTPQGGNS